ncbi:hypothetical protein [Streptomyces zagrosensis]|uniref:Uncharacterized protein n=1 Tax=Streptomyces zagrosensis TaxID=1042984 RepID=A0A7W9QE53_9ACTN|nr:hypothetical protein [Streptomyces zagrosensis]MBB5938605.1 hypothetical protein [Streptomyces zagrosensis]
MVPTRPPSRWGLAADPAEITALTDLAAECTDNGLTVELAC